MTTKSRTQIHYAAAAGDIEELGRLIAEGIPVDTLEPFQGETPLMWAAGDRRAGPDALRCLIDAGASVNARDNDGYTALHRAVDGGRIEKVEALVEAGADVKALSTSGHGMLSSLHARDLALFDYLLARGADPNQASSGQWSDCLVWHLYGRRRFDDLAYVAGRGADLAPLKLPPLTSTLLFGAPEEFEAALSRSPDLEARDFRGATPLLMALRAGNLRAAERLRAAGADILATHTRWIYGMETSNALRAATESDEPSVVRWVLDHGFSVEEPAEFYPSPLFFAVQEDRVASARALLEAGADVHKEDKFGQQPITEAKSIEMAELLVAHGADVNHLDDCGEWPLYKFAQFGDADAVKRLLALGADPARSPTGRTALFPAALRDETEIVRVLLEAGVDVNGADVDREVPLFMVKSRRVLKLLLAAGADMKAQDCIGRPAWQLIEDPDLAEEVRRHAESS